MSMVREERSSADQKRTVFLIGDQPFNRDRVVEEALAAGLYVVSARLSSDKSDAIMEKIHRDGDVGGDGRELPQATEILPDDANAVSDGLLERLGRNYGDDWCVLPLNDYVTEYAATLSARLSERCYPTRSAEVAKRKHELRGLWNRVVAEQESDLFPVEYCYVELNEGATGFDYYPSDRFHEMPERTTLVVKPDELSSSIEIHRSPSKQEAVAAAQQICSQLSSKWYEVGRSIGTEVRPRVIMETAIEASTAFHPGAEYSIEFVSFRGRHHPVGITQKWTGSGFIETGQLFPAESFPRRLWPGLERGIRRLLQELDVGYCVSHWEFIITPDERIGLVEGHLRAAGDRIMELVERSTGQSPTGVLCEALANGEADCSFTPKRGCGVFWLVPEKPLVRVDDIKMDRAKIDDLCEDLFLNEKGIKATESWSQADDWVTRFAHVLATGDGVEQIVERCREVARNVVLSGRAGDRPASTCLRLSIDQNE